MFIGDFKDGEISVGKIKCKVEYVSSENEIKNLIILEMKNRSKLSYIFGGY